MPFCWFNETLMTQNEVQFLHHCRVFDLWKLQMSKDRENTCIWLQTYVRKFSKTRIQNSGQTRFKTDWNEWERKAIQEWRTWAKSLKDAADGQTYRSPFTFREEKRRKKINILTIKHEKNNRFPRTSMELFCMRIFFFQDKPIINS